jgi:trimethyllysine dioxygenase
MFALPASCFERLQMFHLIEFKGQGGESLLVDGFRVAKQLKDQFPKAYHDLGNLKISSHCAGDNAIFIFPQPRYHSLLVHDHTGDLCQIRYNNSDRTVLNHFSRSEVENYYTALQQWQSLLSSSKFEYWFPLKPGTVVVIDNHRVLHGRASFTGHRRMTGCYLNGDDWRSRLRTLQGSKRNL